MAPLLELKGVRKGYGAPSARIEVLGGVDLVLESGEFLSIVSHSGAGKTTLVSILAGLALPDVGEVSSAGATNRPTCAAVFQNRSLLPGMTVYEHVGSCVVPRSGESAVQRRERMERVLALAGLAPSSGRKASDLSDGLRRRLSLAKALATDPQILLMDEPCAGLSAEERDALQEDLSRVWRELRPTAVLLTHDLDEALYLSDRIVPMTPGPNSVLGPSFDVASPRPRDRRAFRTDPLFLRIRNGVLDFLQGTARLRRRALAGALS